MTDQRRFTRTVHERDECGTLYPAREVGTYAGVLNRAHLQGLKSIATTLVQAPTAANQMTAITYAEVVTEKGTFRDYGDASPESVEERFRPHLIRVAMTRAKARALGDAINVGAISIADLSKGDPTGNGNGNGQQPPHVNGGTITQAASLPLTVHQRTRLGKLLALKGYDQIGAEDWLCKTCNVDQIDKITKKQASDMIDHLIADTSLAESSPNNPNGDALP